MSRQIFTYSLPNGLRIILQPSPTGVVYCGYTVGAGTRHELPCERGMAHFIEHLSFKGTEKRRSRHILNRMESVGGDLNAYTTKEETVYHVAALKRDFERAVELLTDIVFHSTFPQGEIDKEVHVILDEIDSYEDTPSELIFDEFEELIFKGDPLGGKILGQKEQLLTFNTSAALKFTERFYNPENMTFFVFGDLEPERVVRVVEKFAAAERPGMTQKTLNPLPPYIPACVERVKNTHQAHVLMGTRVMGGGHADRLGLFFLNNMLGGPGMNSLLNVSLREHSGLVYTVESDLVSYTDTGFWGIYFGCDSKDINRCRTLCLKEIRRLAADSLTESRLRAAKKQLIGQLGVSTDNFESVALGMGKSFLHYNKYDTRESLYEKIEALSAGELQRIAMQVFEPENLTTLIYK